MENEFPQIKSLKEIRMHESERVLMRDKISLFADSKPIFTKTNIPSPFMNSFAIFAKAGAFMILGVIISTSGITVLAKNSLPGDLLFNVKTGIYERIMDTNWAGNDTDKIAWHTNRLEKRIIDMENLSKKESSDFAKKIATREFVKTTKELKDTLTKVSFTGNREIIDSGSNKAIAILEAYSPTPQIETSMASMAKMVMKSDVEIVATKMNEHVLDPEFVNAILEAKIILSFMNKNIENQTPIQESNVIDKSDNPVEEKINIKEKNLENISVDKPTIEALEPTVKTGIELPAQMENPKMEIEVKYDPTKSTQ
jgi:hypothetical protein